MGDATWPLWAHLMVFLADRTGLGEAVTGAIFLGFITALPGLAASVTAALAGHPTVAVRHALGGIAFQTTFLAMADLLYGKADLGHAAASVANLLQPAVLILLLMLVFISLSSPISLSAIAIPAHSSWGSC